MDTVITNGTVVTSSGISRAGVAIEDGRIRRHIFLEELRAQDLPDAPPLLHAGIGKPFPIDIRQFVHAPTSSAMARPSLMLSATPRSSG